jgi:hypothetical protein
MGQEYMLLRGRLMGFPSWQSLAVLIAVASPPRSAQAEEARAAVRAALEQEAMAPSLPPVFPSRSRKESDPSRIARDQSEASANGASAAAKSEAAARNAQGAAASAAKNANADSHAAAGQQRADEARRKRHGPGKDPATPPGPPR